MNKQYGYFEKSGLSTAFANQKELNGLFVPVKNGETIKQTIEKEFENKIMRVGWVSM